VSPSTDVRFERNDSADDRSMTESEP